MMVTLFNNAAYVIGAVILSVFIVWVVGVLIVWPIDYAYYHLKWWRHPPYRRTR